MCLGRYEWACRVQVLGAAAILLLTAACSRPAQPHAESALTFNRDIAPILWQRCGGCHRPGQMAPFSLLDYSEVRPRVAEIARAVQSRVMPPWLPEPGYASFARDRRLGDDEIEKIRRWVEQGAVEGSAEDRQSKPEWPDQWTLGAPDLVMTLPQPYTLHPGAQDEFRNFVLPVPGASTRFVRGMEVRPGNAHVVHHATIGVDRSRGSRELDAIDPTPGYAGMFSEGAQSPDNHALGWTPGMTPRFEPAGTAWRLEAGSDVVIQLHMMPSHLESPTPVQPIVALYFASAPPTIETIDVKLGSKTIDIPAGEAKYIVTDRFRLPADVSLLSVYPHAHYLATEMKAYAALPNGATESLLWIKRWDFKWQDQYEYATPMVLPAGTTLTMEFSYDNSAGNPANPSRPPVPVTYGPQSTDEMGDLWLRLLPRSREDAAAIARAFVESETRKSLEAAERAVAIHPDDARRLGELGARYVESGRMRDGVAHLERARRLLPRDADIRNDLGLALREEGRLTEAIDQLREAVRLAPRRAQIRINLAEALQDNRDTTGAIEHLRVALELEPAAAEWHNNLGVALAARGDIAGAIEEFQRALHIRPEYPDARNNLELVRQTERGR